LLHTKNRNYSVQSASWSKTKPCANPFAQTVAKHQSSMIGTPLSRELKEYFARWSKINPPARAQISYTKPF